ncbi:hypothetical protein HFO33_07280 [Rhizobium leguminosarum]|uniref:hypothetical protein n=1 Tax=Rhizobium leguminosarum TaxID=384 RepID=UPI001C9670AF|nr:hypothetical protein [Rhizobium leguminosarum]MBY5716394.1 hypothetical protein [Rhizobium leguminosarum]
MEEIVEIGRMKTEDAVEKLRAIGDQTAADALEAHADKHPATQVITAGRPKADFDSGLRDLIFGMPSWRAATHLIGYVPADASGDHHAIIGAETIDPEDSLKGQAITVRLLRLGIFDYPGGKGQHDVLAEFGVRDAKSPTAERVHFSQAYYATQPGYAVNGFPVFKDVQIDNDGLSMTCRMVNVCNKADLGLLATLSSPIFQQGLDLAGAFQPAMKPLTELALGLTTAFAKRNENALVQNVQFQLAFTATPFAPRLRQGTYVFVQIPEDQVGLFDWSEWAYFPNLNAVAQKADAKKPLMNNHFVLGISF